MFGTLTLGNPNKKIKRKQTERTPKASLAT